MGNQIVLILLPLVVTGLGFLSYNHPMFTRNLVLILLSLILVGTFIFKYSTDIKIKAKTDVQADILEFGSKLTRIPDSISKARMSNPLKTKIDTLNYEVGITYVSYSSGVLEMQVVALKHISQSIKDENEMVSKVNEIILWAMGGLVVILILCYAFYYLRNPESKKRNDTPNQSPN